MNAETMAAVWVVVYATVIQATLVHIAHAQQIATAYLPHRTAISAAAMVTGFLRTGSLVRCCVNPAIVSLAPSRRVRLVFFLLFQCVLLMWIVWGHGQRAQTTAYRRHLQ